MVRFRQSLGVSDIARNSDVFLRAAARRRAWNNSATEHDHDAKMSLISGTIRVEGEGALVILLLFLAMVCCLFLDALMSFSDASKVFWITAQLMIAHVESGA